MLLKSTSRNHAGRSLLVAASLALTAPGALAQSSDAPTAADADKPAAPVTLDTFVVSATRVPTPIDKTAASITVLDTAALADAGITDAADALRTAPGVTIASNGPGQTVGVFVRGTESRHTSILVDGRRLPTAFTRYFDLAYFPIEAFDRIEVARGPLSSALGGSALGGAFNFLTPRCTTPGTVDGSLKVEYGSFDTRKATAAVRTGTEKGYVNFAANGATTNNERANNEFNSRSAISSFGYALTPVLSLDVIVGYLGFEGGVPGSLTFGSPTQTLDRETAFVLPSLTYRPSDDWAHTLSVSLAKQEDTQRGTSFNFDDDKDVASQSVAYQADWQATDKLRLQAGAERYWQDLEVKPAPGPGGVFGTAFTRYEVANAGFIGASYDITDDLTVIGSARRDVYEEFYGSANTWRYGATYRIPTTGTRLHASDGTAFAAPETQNFAFSFPAITSLEPETSRSQEIGVEQDFFGRKLTIGATAFHTEIKNLVQFVGGAAANVGRAKIHGLETTVDFRPSDTVIVSFNYTYLKAENDLTGAHLVRRPRHATNAQIVWQASDIWTLGAGIHSEIRRFDGAGPVRAENFATLRVFTSVKLREDLILGARVENLFDEDYAEVQGFPALPLAAYASLEWRF